MFDSVRDVAQQHTLWHICGILLLVLLVFTQRLASRSGIIFISLWHLSGVILHELAHLIVGLLFRARPTGFSLWPERIGNSWRLGSVSFARLTAVNSLPVALAPLGLIGVAYLLMQNWFKIFSPSLSTTLALYAALYILLYNALPSRQDLRIASNWRSVLLYLLLGLIAWYLPWSKLFGLFSS